MMDKKLFDGIISSNGFFRLLEYWDLWMVRRPTSLFTS
jgi:hypothetical protein